MDKPWKQSTGGPELPTSCVNLPLKEISRSTRCYLAKYLDSNTCGLNAGNIQQNWVGLAEVCNLDYQSIAQIETQQHPTIAVLEVLQHKPGFTAGNLWRALLDLERFDIIDETFRKMLEKEALKFSLREKEVEERREIIKPLQVDKVSSESPGIDHRLLDLMYDDTQNMVVGDVMSGKTTYFDAFVSYCHDDLDFVMLMVHRLEKDHGLKLCISARDLLAGASECKITADVIAKRCRKVLLVLSPAYLHSIEFDFQCKIALSLSPGAKRKIVIPIKYKHCHVPLVLYHMAPVDYTNADFADWFWERLVASIKEAPGYTNPMIDMNKLSTLEMDMDKDSGKLFTFQSENEFLENKSRSTKENNCLLLSHGSHSYEEISSISNGSQAHNVQAMAVLEQNQSNFSTASTIEMTIFNGNPHKSSVNSHLSYAENSLKSPGYIHSSNNNETTNNREKVFSSTAISPDWKQQFDIIAWNANKLSNIREPQEVSDICSHNTENMTSENEQERNGGLKSEDFVIY